MAGIDSPPSVPMDTLDPTVVWGATWSERPPTPGQSYDDESRPDWTHVMIIIHSRDVQYLSFSLTAIIIAFGDTYIEPQTSPTPR